MPLPLVPLSTIFGGAVVAGIVQFFMTRGGMILAGLGLTFVGVKGFESFIGYMVADFQTVASGVTAAAGVVGSGMGNTNFGALALQVAAYAGFFDGLNIIISGYMAFSSMIAVRFIVARLRS